MKLRNKKLGVVADVQGLAIHNLSFDLYDRNNTKLMDDVHTLPTYYSSLAELNEEWEDYKPTDPLIKDEKIRKAVRAWADVLGIEYIYVFHDEDINCIFRSDFSDLEIQFDGSFEEQIKDGTYTIEELCGEEE